MIPEISTRGRWSVSPATLLLVIALSAVALLQGCQAASDAGAAGASNAESIAPTASHGAAEFCDPRSARFYRRQPTVPWEPVPPERIAEADYYGRTFEARIRIGEQELFAYKVLMNIRGRPIYVSVTLMDHEQASIDVKQLASKATLLLENEARDVARKEGATEALLSLTGNRNDILLWSLQSAWYFTVDAPESFSVFELAGNEVRYVCTYHQ